MQSNIETMKHILWKKKPFPTQEYIMCCILEELEEINDSLKELKHCS